MIESGFDSSKINPIFENPRFRPVRPGNFRAAGHKHLVVDPLIGIADVFGAEWQQDFAVPLTLKSSGEQIEEVKKRSLTAVGHGEILFMEIPAERTF